MKSEFLRDMEIVCLVTPLAGVRIEMNREVSKSRISEVTPLAGVRIEIPRQWPPPGAYPVTPLAGVGIEIAGGNPQ